MSMDSMHMGLSKEAHEFLENHEVKEVGQWLIDEDFYGENYGKILQVKVHSILYPEDDKRYWCQPFDDVHTYAEVVQTIRFQNGNCACDYMTLRDLGDGALYFKWKDEDIIENS